MDDERQTPTPQPGMDGGDAQPRPAPAAPAFAPLPTLRPTHRQPAWRRALTSLIAVAAVVALVGGIAGAMNLNGRLHGGTGSKSIAAAATQTAQANQPAGGPYYRIMALSMDSPTDGFAIVINTGSGDSSGLGDNIIVHISNGVATKQSTLRAPVFGGDTLQALSPTNAWLMLNIGGGDNLYHYDGRAWTIVNLPTPANAGSNVVSLQAFQMVSPTEGWAIGQYSDATTDPSSPSPMLFVYYRYDGSTWRIDSADKSATNASLAASGEFYGYSISGLSATPGGDAWATAWIEINSENGIVSGLRSFIYHRAGGMWRLAQSTPDVQYQGIAMASPNRGWIIGTVTKTTKVEVTVAPYTVTTQNPVALAWDGARWSPARVPPPAQTQLGMQFSQIITTSPTNAWLLGPSNTSMISANSQYASETDYIAHFDGARWTTVAPPQIAAINPNHDALSFNQVSFNLAATTSTGDLWVAGALVVGMRRGGETPLLYHYAGGRWTSVALPPLK